MKRREYTIDIVFNGINIKKVIIDPHFELKHSKSVNDEIILQLVNKLDGELLIPDDIKQPYSYFVEEIILNSKRYKMIWLIEDEQIYIGVVNVYRR